MSEGNVAFCCKCGRREAIPIGKKRPPTWWYAGVMNYCPSCADKLCGGKEGISLTTHEKDQRYAPMTEHEIKALKEKMAAFGNVYHPNGFRLIATIDTFRSRHHLEIDCTDEVITIFCRACGRQQNFQGKITEWPGIVADMREIMSWPHHH